MWKAGFCRAANQCASFFIPRKGAGRRVWAVFLAAPGDQPQCSSWKKFLRGILLQKAFRRRLDSQSQSPPEHWSVS